MYARLKSVTSLDSIRIFGAFGKHGHSCAEDFFFFSLPWRNNIEVTVKGESAQPEEI